MSNVQVPGNEIDCMPLTSAQRGVWQDLQLNVNDPIYSVVDGIKISGSPDIDNLVAAIRHVCSNSSNFRLRFEGNVTDVHQRVRAAQQVDVPILDFSAHDDPYGAAWNWMHADRERPFDVRSDELFRNAILKISPDSLFWYRNYHHLIVDGYTMVVQGYLVCEAYKLLCGAAEKQPVLPTYVDYKDYVRTEAEYRASEQCSKDKQFWNSLYEELPNPVTLSVRRGKGTGQKRRIGVSSVWLPHELLEQCYSLAEKLGVNTGHLLISTIALYFYAVTREKDLPICLPTHGRERGPLMQMSGMCTNTLPLRLCLDPSASVQDEIVRATQTIAKCMEHRRFRYEDFCREQGIKSTDSPFCLHANILRTGEQWRFTDQPVEGRSLSMGAVEDLSFMLVENLANRTHFRLATTFNAHLYEDWEIRCHEQYFVQVLAALVANPEAKVLDLPASISVANTIDASAMSGPASQWPGRQCFHHLVSATAKESPNATAIQFGDQLISYSELDGLSNRIARLLLSIGVQRGTIVGLCCDRSPDVVVGILAIMKAGAAYLPLEPDVPEARIKFMVEDAGVKFIITRAEHELKLPDHLAKLVFMDSMASEISAYSSSAPAEVETEPSDLAYVIYTSGSTGQPKGVLLQHDGLCNLAYAQAELFSVTNASRVLQFAKLSFDASVSEIAMALVSGATLVIADRVALMPGNVGKTLIDQAVSIVTLPPSLLPSLRNLRLPALRILIVAGETCAPEIAKEWLTRCKLINAYGPTETTVCATVGVYDGGEVVHIGKPIANMAARILDEQMRPVPVGLVGELYIGGIGVARGYLNRPELSRERFMPDPFSSVHGDRLYRSGDLARLRPDGNIEFLGRKDQQIKIRGFRVELGEIEAALTAHPAVAESVVVVRDNAGRKQLFGYVVRSDGYERVTSTEVRATLRAQLPDYMVPAAIMFIGALPRTSSGKLDRRALPVPDSTVFDRPYVAPITPTEIRLAKIWGEALELDRVSLTDNFFDIGGDSLATLNVIGLVWDKFAVELPPQQIYESEKLAELASKIDEMLLSGVAQ